jgi:hypothetical protein
MAAGKGKTGNKSAERSGRNQQQQLVPAPKSKRAPVVAAPLLTSPSGYQIRSVGAPDRELITVTAPDGRLCLSITLRPDGPVVEVQAQSLRFASQGLLRLDCDRLEINATTETALRTGALVQDIAGEVRTRAGGDIDVEANAHRMRSRRGDIALQANDDVSLDGERVLLNSPRPATQVVPEQPAPAAIKPGRRAVTPLFSLPGGPARRR